MQLKFRDLRNSNTYVELWGRRKRMKRIRKERRNKEEELKQGEKATPLKSSSVFMTTMLHSEVLLSFVTEEEVDSRWLENERVWWKGGRRWWRKSGNLFFARGRCSSDTTHLPCVFAPFPLVSNYRASEEATRERERGKREGKRMREPKRRQNCIHSFQSITLWGRQTQ